MLVLHFAFLRSQPFGGRIFSGVLVDYEVERWQSPKEYYLTFKFWVFIFLKFFQVGPHKEIRIVQFYTCF